jgi:lysophospholipase L1-like esterase
MIFTTLERNRAAYQERFARGRPEGTAMIGPPGEAAMEEMLEEELWFDGVHSTAKGARVVTDWFARELAELLRDPPPPTNSHASH